MKVSRSILVTGGAGFIGSHLCKRLLDEGNDVICVDNLSSSSKQSIKQFFKNSSFEFIRHDITMPLYVEVDEIYNLACPASPIHYQNDPIQTTKTCVIGAFNMLGLAKRCNAKILQASTSEVYGDPQVHPQDESYFGFVNPNGIRSCYDEGKRCAESLFIDYKRKHNVDIRIARIFNTYGTNMCINDGRVVSNFIVQALEGKDITIYGDGKQTRSFCYIDDLVDGLIRLMNSYCTTPVNLGNPTEYTIHEIAEHIINATGTNSKIIYKELPEDDPMKRKPDISKANKILGWNPNVSFTEGVVDTIEYFREVLNV